MTDPLKIGIVGLGAVARVHLQAYKHVSSAMVTCVADTDASLVGRLSHELGVPGYSTLDEMLGAQSLDLVCVLTPPSSHEALVTQCALAGVNVLCEKPLSLSIESCERMVAICQENEVRLCYGASYRYLSAMTKARDIIRAGTLGQVLLLREYAVGGIESARRTTLGFGHYPKGGPGGSSMGLCDHGIHLIDAFPWLIDSTTLGVSGRGNISGDEQTPEFAHLAYANGTFGQLLYEDGTYTTTLPSEGQFSWGGSWRVGGHGADDIATGGWHPDAGCIHVHGTRASLRIFYYANALFIRDKEGVRQIRLADHPMPMNFALQLEAFVSAILSGAPAPVPGEAGLAAIRTLMSLYAHNGAP